MAHLQAVRTTLQPQQNDYSQLTTYYDEHNQVACCLVLHERGAAPLFHGDVAAGDR